MSINRVVLSGNLTRDPELRTTQSGTPVMNFGIAVNDRRKNSHGEWEDHANFIDCVMFGTRAEGVSRSVSKGTHVSLEGKLRYSQWEKDGQRRSRIEVMVDDIDFKVPRSEPSGYSASNGSQPSSIYDEDIPF